MRGACLQLGLLSQHLRRFVGIAYQGAHAVAALQAAGGSTRSPLCCSGQLHWPYKTGSAGAPQQQQVASQVAARLEQLGRHQLAHASCCARH